MPPEYTPLRHYVVQGAETALPSQWLSGNVPNLASDSVVFGFAQGVALLLLACLLSRHLELRVARPGWLLLGRLSLFLGFFLAWEGALRLGARFDEVYVPDPIAFWKANPELHRQAAEAGFGIVGVGNRPPRTGIFDPDHQGPKPPGTRRFVMLGDSQILCSNFRDYAGGLTWPKVLEARGLRGPAGEPVQIVNAGMSGYSSWQGLLLLRSQLLDLEPDVVVVAFGYHDANPALSHDADILTDDRRVHLARGLLYRSRIYLLFRSAVLRARSRWNDASEPSLWVQRVPPPQFGRNLGAYADLGRERGFRVVVVFEPLREDGDVARTEAHRAEALRVAAERGIPVVDCTTPFAAMPAAERYALFQDLIHLTPEGHRKVAEIVEAGFRRAGILRDAAPSAAAPAGGGQPPRR